MIKIQNEQGKTLWVVKDDASGLPEEVLTTLESEPVEEEEKEEGEQ